MRYPWHQQQRIPQFLSSRESRDLDEPPGSFYYNIARATGKAAAAASLSTDECDINNQAAPTQ